MVFFIIFVTYENPNPMATPFSTQLNFTDVNDALTFVTYLQNQKGVNTAKLKTNAAAINDLIDTVCKEIVTNADPASLQAYTLAQFTPVPPPTTTPVKPTITNTTTPNPPAGS